eukprot:TRINITY_DN16071_c0_g1_i4.p1 TRINITY_DN16071_c0_g1~~TRINITY_DN16071_c0_g1_i4.p1  ORF type:complete len:552 (-),score=59.19 TRINITY_DN16071_c0_g1_i4:106-1632(-)
MAAEEQGTVSDETTGNTSANVRVTVVTMVGVTVMKSIDCSPDMKVRELAHELRCRHEHLPPRLVVKLMSGHDILKPHLTLASVQTSDGDELTLTMVIDDRAYELQFNGRSCVSVGDLHGIPVGNFPRSVSVEFYPTAAVCANLVSWGSGRRSGGRFSLHLVAGAGKVCPCFCGQSNDHFKGGTHAVPLNQWSHATVTYNGAGSISLFVNGKCVGTANAGSLETAADAQLFIGKNTENRADEFFIGSMASARIWNRALRPEEVQELHETSDIPQHGLVADWQFVPEIELDSQEHAEDGQFDGDRSIKVREIAQKRIPVGNAPRTVSVEFYPTAAALSNLVSWGGGRRNGGRFSLHLVPNGGKVCPCFCGQSNDHFKDGAHAVPLNQWSHAAVTYDGAGSISLFVNGICVGTANAGSLETAADAQLCIGKNTENRADEFFIGAMASARIWNRALRPEEVQDLHLDKAVSSNGLVWEWLVAKIQPTSNSLLDGMGGHDGIVCGATWAEREY